MSPPSHVYVHVPFCARRCVYCDFAIVVRKEVPWGEFTDALGREMDIRFGSQSLERTVTRLTTLYLGGGTPSRLGPEGIGRLLDLVRSHWDLAPGAEVTIEANPEDVIPGDVEAWQDAGVNRVSLGVQSLDDDVLRWMHRTHDAAQAVRAARTLRAAGVDDWSLDLIFALPPELRRSWRDDLNRAVDLGPTHVSCYGLTVEAHTPLSRWHDRGQVSTVADERYAGEFLLADSILQSAGFEHYEVSNYARPGRRSRHNSAYWQRAPYVGLGPSAHGFDGARRRWNERDYRTWLNALDQGRDPIGGSEELSPDAEWMEAVFLGLRSSEGWAMEAADRSDLKRWEEVGWVKVKNGRVHLTPQGWLRMDTLVTALTSIRSR